MRYWRAFTSQEERKQWEQTMKRDNPDFVLCFRLTARQLENEMYFPKGHLWPNKYAAVYMFRERKQEAED